MFVIKLYKVRISRCPMKDKRCSACQCWVSRDRSVSRSAIYDLDLVLDLGRVCLDLDLDLGASDLGIFSRDQLEINLVIT